MSETNSTMQNESRQTFQKGQFLTFHVKDQIFGLDILHVREIIEYSNVTPVPLVPEFIKGILNLRGNVVPVLDVSSRFGWAKTDIQKMTCIVVTEIDYDSTKLEIGLVVDSVNEVVDLNADKVEESPNFGTNVRSDFVKQIGKVDGKFVLLLNITKLLDVQEIQKLRDSRETNDSVVGS